jgi:hypothetical protein
VLSPMAQKKLDGRLLRMRALVTMKRSLGETRQTRSKMQLEGVRAQQDLAKQEIAWPASSEPSPPPHTP